MAGSSRDELLGRKKEAWLLFHEGKEDFPIVLADKDKGAL